jgi:hypothetical protein
MFYYFLLALLSATLLALLEIQIEGRYGWAEKLPTWKFYKDWFKYFPGGNKPITGYHLWLWLFVFTLLHFAFLFSGWNLGKELITISFIIFLLRLEDFLWFVFNPHFGIKKFKRKFIPWHSSWVGPIPTQYLISMITWAITFYFGFKLELAF